MRIFFSSDSDPMLLDSKDGLNALCVQLKNFVVSDLDAFSIEGDCSGKPAPCDEFLKGLRIRKADGPLKLGLSADRWLELVGDAGNLSRYVEFFHFTNESGHHHLDHSGDSNYIASDSMSLIIEADSE